jgi:hypothetical protein
MLKKTTLITLVATLAIMAGSSAFADGDLPINEIVVMMPGEHFDFVFDVEDAFDVTKLNNLQTWFVLTLGDAANLSINLSPSDASDFEELMINYMLIGFAYSPGSGLQVINERAFTPNSISADVPINAKFGFVFLNVVVTNVLRELDPPVEFTLSMLLDEQ